MKKGVKDAKAERTILDIDLACSMTKIWFWVILNIFNHSKVIFYLFSFRYFKNQFLAAAGTMMVRLKNRLCAV